MNIREAYKILLETTGFSPEEVEDKKSVRLNCEPRDVICILLDAFGYCTAEVASLLGIHPNTVYQSLNRERMYRLLSRSVYLAVIDGHGRIIPDCSEYDNIYEALSELGLKEEQVRCRKHQGKKNRQIHEICLLYRKVKGRVSMKTIEDFTGTSHTSINKYMKTCLFG